MKGEKSRVEHRPMLQSPKRPTVRCNLEPRVVPAQDERGSEGQYGVVCRVIRPQIPSSNRVGGRPLTAQLLLLANWPRQRSKRPGPGVWAPNLVDD